MLTTAFLALLAVSPIHEGNGGGDGPFSIRATFPEEQLRLDGAGGTATLVVELELEPGWELPRNPLLPASAPAPLLQLAPSAGVVPVGPVAETLDALLRAGLLDLPWERMLAERTTRVELRFPDPLPADAAVELNVVAYASAPDDERVRLHRRRYRLPVRPGAVAEEIDAGRAAWGGERQAALLHVGERAEGFEIATPFGESLRLADVLGDGPVVVSLQRSCL
jgi:hypothetical protein